MKRWSRLSPGVALTELSPDPAVTAALDPETVQDWAGRLRQAREVVAETREIGNETGRAFRRILDRVGADLPEQALDLIPVQPGQRGWGVRGGVRVLIVEEQEGVFVPGGHIGVTVLSFLKFRQ